MAPRANWKEYLRLSLVSCPIALYPASSLSEKVSFNRINRKTGNRLKQQNVDSETGEVLRACTRPRSIALATSYRLARCWLYTRETYERRRSFPAVCHCRLYAAQKVNYEMALQRFSQYRGQDNARTSSLSQEGSRGSAKKARGSA
jgi:hypothetical protein